MCVLTPGLADPLGESMTTHSNIPAWGIPWTEGPDGLQFMEYRAGHDWSDLAQSIQDSENVCAECLCKLLRSSSSFKEEGEWENGRNKNILPKNNS